MENPINELVLNSTWKCWPLQTKNVTMNSLLYYSPSTGKFSIYRNDAQIATGVISPNFSTVEPFMFRSFPTLLCYSKTSGNFEILHVFKSGATKTLVKTTHKKNFTTIVPFVHANELFYLIYNIATADVEIYKVDLKQGFNVSVYKKFV